MQCDYFLESYWTVLSCGAVCFMIQCGANVLVCGSNHAVWPFFGKLLNSTFMWCCLFYDTVWFQLFSLWIKPCSVIVLWKATEQYFHVVLFVLWYNESFICGSNHAVWPLFGNLLNSTYIGWCILTQQNIFWQSQRFTSLWLVNLQGNGRRVGVWTPYWFFFKNDISLYNTCRIPLILCGMWSRIILRFFCDSHSVG